MRRLAVFILVAVLLVLIPLSVEARQSRVYIRFSIGSAVVVGGGYLAWNLNYGYRISRKDKEPTGNVMLAKSTARGQRLRPATFQNHLAQNRPVSYQPLVFELPLIVFRW